MVEQCLSNKNESATVEKSKKISQLNKALMQMCKLIHRNKMSL